MALPPFFSKVQFVTVAVAPLTYSAEPPFSAKMLFFKITVESPLALT